ncbi:MAG: iron chelate uptake ABC transporter family permease subunit, partial [Desulfovibrionales bacterium]|nr:iron chelate uptake ABC transporter family permease subunit [Desulfovibrionales bacterium]
AAEKQGDGVCERLKQACPEDWGAYTGHAFVRGLGDGSLAEPCFRWYLAQGGILWKTLAGAFFGEGPDALVSTVVVDVRLPRILTAALVGAGLSVSGAVYQGILLNPLADPYTLGISAGAAFGAALAILFLPNLPHILPLAAFAGAIATLAGVIFLSSGRTFGREGLSSNSLILSGIIVASILSAGISFLKYLADEEVSIIIFWLMGSFASKTWADVILVFCVILIGGLVMLFFARDLNLISLGKRAAATLGVDTGRVTLWLLLAASVTAAVCVSVSGIIGFVGLLVPHMVRAVTGPDNRCLIPVSALAGAVLMLGADTLTRAILPVEIPIGILTALLGGPVFCYLFRKSHGRRTP